MSDTSAGPVRVLLVADAPAFRERARASLSAVPRLSVTAVAGVDELPGDDEVSDADAILCADRTIDDRPVERIERCRAAAGGAAIVLLASPGADDVIESAISAGVDDCFPRSTADAGPSLIADRLAELDGDGDEDGDGNGNGSRPPSTPTDGRVRALADRLDEVLVLVSADFSEVLYVNPAYEELFGRPAAELYDDPWSVLAAVHPDDRDAYREDMEQMLADFEAGDAAEAYEGTYRLGADEETRWIDVTRYPIRDDTGEVRRFAVSISDVTDREEYERTYREVFENVTDGLVLHEPDTGVILDVNERFCEMNGYERDALVGEDIGVVTAGGEYSTEAAAERIERARTEGPQLFEFRNRHRSGETFPVEVHLSVVRIRGRERVLASVRDITDRKRRQREYEQIFEKVNDAIAVHDPDAEEMIDANRTLCDLVGASRERLLERGIGGISVAEQGYTAERAYEIMGRVVDEGEPERHEWLVETEAGERLWLEANVAPAEIGGEQRALVLSRDVTARKERERELREAEERFRAVTEHVDEVIFITKGVLSFDAYEDPPEDREVEYLSPAFERIFGMSVDEVYEDAAAYQEPIHPDDVGDLRDMLREFAADEEAGDPQESYEVEVRVRNPERGVRWVHITTYPTRSAGSDAYRLVGIMEDVTDRKRRERTIRNLHDATERIQEATTPEAVAEAAIEAARDVLGLPTAACWFHRRSADGPRLEPIAGTTPDGEFVPDAFEPGDIEYEAFEESSSLVYDPSEHTPDYSLSAAIMLPLGDHGLLGIGRREVMDYDDFLVDAARALAGHVRTALDRVERARELRESERRFREIAERIDQIVYLANEDLTELLYINPAYEEIYGRPTEDLREDPRSFVEAVHPADEPAYREAFEAMMDDIEAGDPRDAYDFAFRIRRPDGESRWLEATGYPVLDEGGEPYRFVGLVEDVTERKERERRLETFHETTRRLTEATSRREATRIAVDAAEEVLELPHVSIHCYDDSAGDLRPVAATDALAGEPDELPSFPPGENLPWQVFVDGESVRLSAADGATAEGATADGTPTVYGPDRPAPELLLPLGSHGVMLVEAAGDSSAGDRTELAQILAATVQAALDHVEGERELERREEELRREQERTARLDRLNRVIRDIEQATVEKSTREAIEAAVCDRLTDVEPYAAAWIAAADVGEDSLSVRTSAGESTGYLDHLDLAADAEDGLGVHPAAVALRESTVRVRREIAGDAPHAEWQQDALRRGHQAVLAVPLDHGGVVHGVLAVAAGSPTAFDEEERAVLEELGRSIGYELGVIERRRALESDTTTELEFDAGDDDLAFVALSDREGCRVEFERSIRRSEAVFSVFYSVEGVPPERAVGAAERLPAVRAAQVIGRDDETGLIEVRTESWFGTLFTGYGGVIRTALASEGEGRVSVEIPGRVDTREIVGSFRERYPDVELIAKRDRERAVRTVLELQDILAEQLTGRQLEALETAYSAGYFEWPRLSSGEDIADLLGITQPTFNKHLRAAERKTYRLLLDREHPADQ